MMRPVCDMRDMPVEQAEALATCFATSRSAVTVQILEPTMGCVLRQGMDTSFRYRSIWVWPDGTLAPTRHDGLPFAEAKRRWGPRPA